MLLLAVLGVGRSSATAIAAAPAPISMAAAPPSSAAALPSLTAAELLARFDASDPRLEELEARIEAARADWIAARLRPNPALSYVRETVYAPGRALPEDFVTLSWPLDLSGRRGLRVAAAAAGVDATRASAVLERVRLALEALELYYDAAFLRLRHDVLRDGREALRTVIGAVRARASAGDSAEYDLQRLEIELGVYDDALAEAALELAVARRGLGRLAGDPETPYDAADPLALPAAPPPIDELLAGTLETRGDRRAARLRMAGADRALSAARRWWLPPLRLTGGLKVAALDASTAVGWIAGVAIDLPLLDRAAGDVARARAERHSAEAEALFLEREIVASVRAAHEALIRRLDQAAKWSAGVVLLLPDLVRRAEVSYREGERPIFELLDAHRAAREARLRELALRRAAWKSVLDLARATGRRP